MPSPQLGNVQLFRQPSVSMSLPSSQASPPFITASPQKVQPGFPQAPVRHTPWEEGAPAGKAFVSHVSQVSLMAPSPHANLQSVLQPSPSIALPSSQSSAPAGPFTTPSPQKLQLSMPHAAPARHAPWVAGAFAGNVFVSHVSQA